MMALLAVVIVSALAGVGVCTAQGGAPECSDARLYLADINDTVNNAASMLLTESSSSKQAIESLGTRINVTTKDLSGKVDLSMDKVDKSAEAIAFLVGTVSDLANAVDDIAKKQAKISSTLSELKGFVKEMKQSLNSHGLETAIYDSCMDVLQRNPNATSGYYPIRFEGEELGVYCDMEGTNCGGEGGWMRIADVDMSRDDATCPDGLYPYKFKGLSYRVCDYRHYRGGRCDSTIFSTFDVPYSSVCGRVRGYQYGFTDGLYRNNYGSQSINSFYVDGVSITHGDPRQHIWTFACGQGEETALWEDCPCNRRSRESVLSFIGDNYYCESGFKAPTNSISSRDPLWDGKKCRHRESACCKNPNLPYFIRALNSTITDDIELRICGSEGYPDEAVPVDIIELYVR